MRHISALVAGIALAVAVAGCSRPTGVAAAADAMGATNLNSIQFSGTGANFAFGQAYSPGGPWPRFDVKSYTAAVDYQAPAMRLEMVRAQGEHPPRGGGAQPFAVDQRTVQVVSGTFAWSEGGAQPAPNPAAVDDRLRQIWVTPHGVVKAAVAGGVTATGNTFTVKAENRDVKVTLDDQNLVQKVEYVLSNSVIGDYPVEVTYSDYADYGGVKFPKHIVEKQDGFETLDLTVTDVKPNAAVALPVPANVSSAPAPPASVAVTIEKVADGIWSVNGAGTRSLAVEFADHIVMLEGPTSDARSKAANELVRKTVPSKPITYVVNTHAHYDHAGGLRQYVAEGITVITHESNKAFYEQAWARPHTVEDTAPTSNKPTIETVADKKVLSDRTRTVELYFLAGHGHHTGQLIAYLPKERILLYGDAYNPPAGDEIRTPERGPEYAAQLYQKIQELKLTPTRIAPVHGRVVPFQNMLIAFGLNGPNATR
ncbi:MAG: MBL fold metallo-hydrolase [Acidobacteria bacterium]|nr:MBL fold metallo-hydrolase [Acidobacteriota bacterium]